jgi:hypothetical protein
MHHLKETVIDGVKFVLIPEELHDKLVILAYTKGNTSLIQRWKEYDSAAFTDLEVEWQAI